nr:hypothetical protein [Ferrovibrio terrae]
MVTPNMLRPSAGRVSLEAGMLRVIIPASACAALARITRDNLFSPAISVTGYSMAMSCTPTKAETSPAASVDTISLGRPIGCACMAAAMAAAEQRRPEAGPES